MMYSAWVDFEVLLEHCLHYIRGVRAPKPIPGQKDCKKQKIIPIQITQSN